MYCKMYCAGTHSRKWTFKNEATICQLRTKANAKYIQNYNNTVRSVPSEFLTVNEERLLCKYFEGVLGDFCRKFKPPMPKSVISCSFHYFKRFYLNNSVMDYHPKHIIVTCVYLACKVEEFNVSMVQFIANVKGDRAKAKEIILSHELLLMDQLEYNLIIHHPYRPIEGFLIDIKTRCPDIFDPERLRPAIDEFLDAVCFTDAFLLYPPSQLALAAVSIATSNYGDDFNVNYVAAILLGNIHRDKVSHLLDVIENIKAMVKNLELPRKDQVKTVRMIEKKLENCRNEENNPSSDVYMKRRAEMLEEEELEQTRKYARLTEQQNKDDEELLGTIQMET